MTRAKSVPTSATSIADLLGQLISALEDLQSDREGRSDERSVEQLDILNTAIDLITEATDRLHGWP